MLPVGFFEAAADGDGKMYASFAGVVKGIPRRSRVPLKKPKLSPTRKDARKISQIFLKYSTLYKKCVILSPSINQT